MINHAEYVAPSFLGSAFHCVHCKVYAHQVWFSPIAYQTTPPESANLSAFRVSKCKRCSLPAIWHDQKLVHPAESPAPLPTKDMPGDVSADFLEARLVFLPSPRSAAALLRQSIQRLCKHLGLPGKNLDSDIGELVKQGLPATIQKALDTVRVIGNNAVHPLEIDLRDTPETALALFKLTNMIVLKMISEPLEVGSLFDALPEGAKSAIQKRDKA